MQVSSKALEMIFLCQIAYEHPAEISGALSGSAAPPTGGWRLEWGPAFNRDVFRSVDNLVYLASSADAPDEWAIVIRGTTSDSIQSWIDDRPGEFKPFPLAGPQANVTEGLREVLSQMTSESPKGANSKGSGTLKEALVKAEPRVLYVTGHSQGAATATMLAFFARAALPSSEVRPCTFAGQTAGDPAFAAALAAQFPGQWRFANSHDIVPRAYDELESLREIYAPTIEMNVLERLALDAVEGLLNAGDYAQPPSTLVTLPGKLAPGLSWSSEVEHQHATTTYVELVRAWQNQTENP